MKNKSFVNYLLLVGIGIICGAQFGFNAVALRTLPPDIVVTARVVIGAFTLVILAAIFKKDCAAPIVTTQSVLSIRLRYVLIAILQAIIPFSTLAWGQQYLDSSVSALLIGMIPIFTGVIVAVFISTEKVTRGMVISIVVGFIGLLVLVAPSLLSAKKTNLLAEGVVLGGAFCFASAMALIKTMPDMSPIRMSRNVLVLAAIPMVIYVAITNPQALKAMNREALFCLMMLGVFCSGIVYIMFVKLINRAGATFASLSNYLVPLFGSILGVLLLGDPLHYNMVLALIIILGSLGIGRLPMFNKKEEEAYD